MHLADAFIQSDLQCIQVIRVLSVCVPWELNPQPFALQTQCSTTEPQEHQYVFVLILWYIDIYKTIVFNKIPSINVALLHQLRIVSVSTD